MYFDGVATAAPAIRALLEAALSVGGLRAASRQAGRKVDALQGVRRSGRVPFRTLCAFLDALPADPGAFFAYAYGLGRFDCAPLERFGEDALTEALRHREPGEAGRLRLAVLRGELPPTASSDAAALATVAEIDELRYDDARHAADRGRLLCARAASMTAAAAGLGTWASALRTIQGRGQAERMRTAQGLCWLALRISAARPEMSPTLAADLLQRAGYILAARTGRYADAEHLARTAERIYLEIGDVAGSGRAMVDRGTFQRWAGDYTSARGLFDRALERLPADDSRNRFAALRNLAEDAAAAGNRRLADRLATDALAHVTSPAAAARIQWLRARIATFRGQDAEAARLYRLAGDAVADREPIEAAMIGGERVRVLARLGRLDQAGNVARAMAWAVSPLEAEAPNAAAALADLIGLALDVQQLTAATIERAALALESSLARAGAANIPPAIAA